MSLPDQGSLAGIDEAMLRKMLADAQSALGKVMTGRLETIVMVTGGGQHREVTFSKTNVAQLRVWIAELQRILGISVRPRRAIAVSF